MKKYNSIKFLLRQGTTDNRLLLSEKDQNYYIMKAIRQNDFHCVKHFLENAVELHHPHHNKNSDGRRGIEIKDSYGSTPLILSYKLNPMEIFRYFIKVF